MSTFIHTSEDFIVIDSSKYPLSFFLIQEPAYALPAGADTQYYNNAIPYRLASDGKNQILYSEALWVTGDGYIANKATYDAAYDDYINYPDLPTAKLTAKRGLQAYSDQKKSAHISYGGNTYDSIAYGEIMQFLLRFARVADIGPSFYLRDIAETEHILDQDDMRKMQNLVDDLHRLCDENRDIHHDAIDALGTIAAVKAYDYTTGWPTVPYTG